MNKSNKFINLIEEKTMPIVELISNNKILLAIRDGLVLSMPLMIVGSIAIVIGDFPVPAFQAFMASIFGESWNWWNWEIIHPATIGIVALFTTFGIAYSLARSNDVEPLPAGMIAVSSFFILLVQLENGGFSADDFGARGLFMGIITSIISTLIYIKIIKKKFIIKMPDSVPPSISRSFAALIPAAIIIPLFVIIRVLFSMTPYESATNFILNVLQIPLLGVGTSFIGTEITAGFFNTFFWIFGIHGTLIVQSVMQPIWEAAKYANLAAFQAGTELPYIVTTEYLDHFVFLGGAGITLPLCIMLAFKARSKQLRDLGKLALVPSIFNVNEPIIYGLPIVMNPIMAIPFFITPMISIAISYAAMALNIVSNPTGVAVPFTTPAPIGGFLITGDIKAAILQIVILLLAGLIYWPFFKIWDRKSAKEEEMTKGT
ncbi:PTS sugar transporter subunit IIC [Oceanobacillus jeddahense]|uniref:Permease IIC component n=1 Tax=Oceanobacillus jeddahense TaxID=1462527 RepID=A0ABY5JL99_9BACI|nr:PTS transporter subunit EIIC [Oceanobacillus jeddahense]UUI01080.1 PTS transporter subunit EIIC [Oceanobacillus jeddahense]